MNKYKAFKLLERSVVAAFFFSATACQSYQEGVQAICDAPIDCPECATKDHGIRAALLAQHLDEKLSNEDAKALFKSLTTLEPIEKSSYIENQALGVGIKHCAMAGFLKAQQRAEDQIKRERPDKF